MKKRILAILLAVMMLAALSVGALADDPPAGDGSETPTETTTGPSGSITIKPSTTVPLKDKVLKAYKILNATYSPATGDLETGAKQAIAYTIPAALTSFYDEYFGQKADASATPPVEAKTASELAAAAGKTLDAYVTEQMKDWGDDSAQIKDFAAAALAAAKAAKVTAIEGVYDDTTKNVEFAGRDAGYYVIEDEGEPTPLSAVMLDTVTDADVEITLKASDDSKKEIMTAGDLVNSKANELGLGRAVNYKISQKIPDTTGYDYYYYMINDTLSEGLTFNPETVVVTVGGTKLTEGTDYYLYYVGDAHSTTAAILGGKTFIVAFKDVVADVADTEKDTFTTGAAVEITYTATVNSNAVTGVDPNNNKASVEYSNNPDKDGKGDYDTNHPGIPANDGNHPTGVGPDKYTDTYTTKVTIKKVGEDGKTALPGVEFTLTGTAKDAVFDTEKVFEEDPAGEYWLLNDGTYTKTPPETAPTVEETTGGAGWVEIGSDETVAAGVAVRVVGEKSYRPYVEATDSAKTRYVIVEANEADYASTTTKYALVTKTANAAEDYEVARTGVTGSDGTLDFSQLGAGTYKLSETGILAGYNGIEDIEFTVACELPDAEDVIAGTEKATWTITTDAPGVTFTEQKDNDGNGMGVFEITIQNNKGTELPSTGGIGTTIFYIVGAVLVLGAAVLLITRRRMHREEV